MGEEVILVDSDGHDVGTASRIDAHRRGLMHRAVSVFLFDSGGRLLLQERAAAKATFAGRWANSCCTHVRPGETAVETGERRLLEELGIKASLELFGTFIYDAEDAESGLIEHEFDHVLVGRSEDEPDPNPEEVAGTRWVDLESLREEMESPEYAPWLAAALRALPDLGPGSK